MDIAVKIKVLQPEKYQINIEELPGETLKSLNFFQPDYFPEYLRQACTKLTNKG